MTEAPDTRDARVRAVIATCHRVLHVATGIILTAFVLIILITTVPADSPGPAARAVGKALYFVIVTCALLCLMVWYYRSRLEKRLEAPGGKDA
ncbi:MAG: hypothetical protein AB1505_06420 [Candidatus Latescibacterota bacterium]